MDRKILIDLLDDFAFGLHDIEQTADRITELYKQDQALQLQQTGVVWRSEQFYCNQNDGEYNNNPCSEQCRFCKEAESLQ